MNPHHRIKKVKVPEGRAKPDIPADLQEITFSDDILAEPEISFRERLIENVSFKERSLKSVVLEACILKSVSFARCNLRGCDSRMCAWRSAILPMLRQLA